MLRETRGASAIEYGLIAALIAIAATTAMSALGSQMRKTFNNVTAGMEQGTGSAVVAAGLTASRTA